MNLRQFVLVGVGASAVLAACAAVTGLGDYEVVDCTGLCGDASDANEASSTSQPDAGGADGTSFEAAPDAAGPDAGIVVVPDAGPPFTPSCARVACPPGQPNVSCIDDTCVGPDSDWTEVVKGNNINFDRAGGSEGCEAELKNVSGGAVDDSALLRGSLAGGSRYDFELRFVARRLSLTTSLMTIARVTSGATAIEVRIGDKDLRLCVNGLCSETIDVPTWSQNAGATRFDVYGRWGSSVASSKVFLAAGGATACDIRREMPLPAPASGALVASVGCHSRPCSLTFDELSFSTIAR